VRALNGARPPLDGEARAAVATLHGLYGCRLYLPLATVLPASVSQLSCPFYSAQVKRQMARILHRYLTIPAGESLCCSLTVLNF
jgi:hypothetical protein